MVASRLRCVRMTGSLESARPLIFPSAPHFNREPDGFAPGHEPLLPPAVRVPVILAFTSTLPLLDLDGAARVRGQSPQ